MTKQIKRIVFHPSVLMSNHASQVMSKTSKSAAEELLNHRKVKFTLHPTDDLMVTIGSDNERVFWNLQTHTSVYSDILPSTPACVKFSPSPDTLLVTGFEDGTVDISTIKAEREKKKLVSKGMMNQRGHSRGLMVPKDQQSADVPSTGIIYRSLQSLFEPSCKVLNIEFSQAGTYMAVSYLNKRDPEEGEERVTGIVSVMKKVAGDLGKSFVKEAGVYQRWITVTTAALTNLTPMTNYACNFMNFTLSEHHLILSFQQFDKFDLREHDDKERNYLVWDLLKNERQDNMEAISDAEVGLLIFPSHVNAHYRYHERYLEANKLLLAEG